MDKIAKLLEPYLKDKDFDVVEWATDPKNILYLDEYDNIAIFEPITDTRYSGHYYFVQRGKEALVAAKKFLEKFFTENPHIAVLQGFVPVEHLGARWMSRQIGLKSYGVEETTIGPVEMFILTRNEYMAQRSQG
jgi:hypothetical protein